MINARTKIIKNNSEEQMCWKKERIKLTAHKQEKAQGPIAISWNVCFMYFLEMLFSLNFGGFD